MRYLALYHWSNFQTYMTLFGGVVAQELRPKFQIKHSPHEVSRGTFYKKSTCDCQVTNFQRISYDPWNVPFLRVLMPLLSQIRLWFPWNFQQKYSFIKKTRCLKSYSKFWVFPQKGQTQSLQFYIIFMPYWKIKNIGKRPKFLQKLHFQDYQIELFLSLTKITEFF